MANLIPESHREMLEGPVYGVLNTHMPSGDIQSTLVWFNYKDGHVWINTKRGRVKEKNIAANPKVSLLAVDTTNPWKYISIRGHVDEIIEEGAMEHIDELTQLYLGQPNFYGFVEPEEAKQGITRCMLKIAVDNVMVVGE